jgi:aminobenzoyl-glutamate utilization protein B
LRRVRRLVKRFSAQAVALAEEIAELAEPPLGEFQSSARLMGFLAGHGFQVSRPWKHLPTAFRAVAGTGRPRIALLAEYDALPDCGRRPGQYGHGCGHNLLGSGSALAGVVAAATLRRLGRAGQITVIGAPAEETLGGKVYIAARRGFAGLDAVLAWHPGAKTQADIGGGSALDSIVFSFRGRTAHAAGGPHEGRSALDGAILTDVAVNYLREHVEENTRMHSVITRGGRQPNVVPDRADIWYYVRGKDRKQTDALRLRVVRCARAAAMATETRLGTTVLTSCTERIANRALAEMLDALLRRLGAPRFSAADKRAARRIAPGKKFETGIQPIKTTQERGSSDEDNVSWFAPLGRLSVACTPTGTLGHHRQYAAMVRTSGAHRGMLKAAEVLAAAAVEIALNPPLLRKAKAEFRKNLSGKRYRLPISPRVLSAPLSQQLRVKPEAP